MTITTTLSLTIAAIFMFLGSFAGAQSALEIKKTETEIREQMLQISEDLGVACTECHSLKNFKDSSLMSFKVAKEHIKLTELLRRNGMDGKSGAPDATCFMCHRGHKNFQWKKTMKHVVGTKKDTSNEVLDLEGKATKKDAPKVGR